MLLSRSLVERKANPGSFAALSGRSRISLRWRRATVRDGARVNQPFTIGFSQSLKI